MATFLPMTEARRPRWHTSQIWNNLRRTRPRRVLSLRLTPLSSRAGRPICGPGLMLLHQCGAKWSCSGYSAHTGFGRVSLPSHHFGESNLALEEYVNFPVHLASRKWVTYWLKRGNIIELTRCPAKAQS